MKNYLMGIGIDRYESIQSLSNAVRDTKAICDILSSKYGFEDAEYLIDSEATNENLHKTFKDFHSKMTEDDNLLIYYAGHGDVDDGIGGYWVPYDAQIDKTTSYFLNSTLLEYIKNSCAKHITIISDSCFSRSILLDSDNKTRSLSDYEKQKSRWAITSGRKPVPDGVKGGHSPFAERIINFLTDNKRDFLVSDLSQDLKKISYNSDQNPQGAPLANVGHDGGEFIFKQKSSKRKIPTMPENELKGYSDIAKILQLYEPKARFEEYKSLEDKAQKIGYSLFRRENKPLKQMEYYLYLYKGINQTATLNSLKSKCSEIFRKNLIILLPREDEQKKQEIRKKNIQDKFKPTSIYYVDEFIWDLCTPKSFTDITTDSKFLDINNFVTPRVEDENKNETKFDDLIEWLSSQNEQVLVLRGSGGIGKTTIAKYIADVFQQDTKKQKRSIFIESSEIIDELKRTKTAEQEINIYNFYEADYSKSGFTQDKLNNDLFKVNLDNGNLLIVIDGLDEIISKVPNFDVNVFLRSIFDSYSEIGNAKVIITCRTHFWDENKIDDYSLKVSDLLPFNEAQAKNFFDKSFKAGKKTEKCIKIAKEFISQSKDKEPDEYQPYVLDIIRNIVDSDYELLNDNYSFDSKYLIQKIKSDYIIYNVCHREIKRINQISVDEQIEFFMSLSVQYDGVIAESKFSELFNSVDTSKIEALKSHPFISTDKSAQKNVFVKYDFLIDVFKGLYLKSLLDIKNNELISKNTIQFIASNCGLNSNLVREVVGRSQKLSDEEIIKIVDTIDNIQKFDTTNILKIKAISGLFSLALRINHKYMGTNIENNTKLMEDLFSKNNEIHSMAMFNFSSYENQIRFDFSNKTFIKCYIDNFSDFWSCKFNKHTYFIDCTIYNLQSDPDIQIDVKENQFQNCAKDASVSDVFKNSKLKEKNIEKQIEKFIESFFYIFLKNGKFVPRNLDPKNEQIGEKDDIKSKYKSIKPSLFKLEKLVKILYEGKVIDDFDGYSNKSFKIADDYKMDVTKFCKEGTMSSKINKIIKLLVENLS
jgi:hypothetical protein